MIRQSDMIALKRLRLVACQEEMDAALFVATAFHARIQTLSLAQQQAFLDAVRRYIIDPLLMGKQPPSQIFHKLSGYNIYEFRWDSSGRFRATCQMLINAAGEVEIEWRRIGSHAIYQDP